MSDGRFCVCAQCCCAPRGVSVRKNYTTNGQRNDEDVGRVCRTCSVPKHSYRTVGRQRNARTLRTERNASMQPESQPRAKPKLCPASTTTLLVWLVLLRGDRRQSVGSAALFSRAALHRLLFGHCNLQAGCGALPSECEQKQNQFQRGLCGFCSDVRPITNIDTRFHYVVVTSTHKNWNTRDKTLCGNFECRRQKTAGKCGDAKTRWLPARDGR